MEAKIIAGLKEFAGWFSASKRGDTGSLGHYVLEGTGFSISVLNVLLDYNGEPVKTWLRVEVINKEIQMTPKFLEQDEYLVFFWLAWAVYKVDFERGVQGDIASDGKAFDLTSVEYPKHDVKIMCAFLERMIAAPSEGNVLRAKAMMKKIHGVIDLYEAVKHDIRDEDYATVEVSLDELRVALLGKTLAEAERIYFNIRVVRDGNRLFAITDDLIPERLNVVIADGKITEVQDFG